VLVLVIGNLHAALRSPRICARARTKSTSAFPPASQRAHSGRTRRAPDRAAVDEELRIFCRIAPRADSCGASSASARFGEHARGDRFDADSSVVLRRENSTLCVPTEARVLPRRARLQRCVVSVCFAALVSTTAMPRLLRGSTSGGPARIFVTLSFRVWTGSLVTSRSMSSEYRFTLEEET